MKIYNQYNNIKEFSNPGNPEYNLYSKDTLPDGTIKIFITETRNRYNEIQEAGIGCSLKEIIEKYKNGYIESINQDEATYTDTSNFPDNSIEINNLKNLTKNTETLNLLQKTIENIIKEREKNGKQKNTENNTQSNDQINNEQI